uniref:Zinc finger C3HC4 RING-type domain-containing protein n=1 Tax=Junco hyemalis TaxID=40217 RepID=A0A8C5NRG8_JUNHY
MRRPAYVTFCMHKFCLSCIQQWARTKDNCGKSRVHVFLFQIMCQLRSDSLSWHGSYKLSCWSKMMQQPMTRECLNLICLFPFTALGNLF